MFDEAVAVSGVLQEKDHEKGWCFEILSSMKSGVEGIPNMISYGLRGATISNNPQFAKTMPILCACNRIYHTMYQPNLSYRLA